MRLTETEKAILKCLAEGMQSKEIAARIGRSKPTVEGHVRSLLGKFDARSRAHLVAKAIHCEVILPPLGEATEADLVLHQ
jgi:DNA-binding CsgD family transcriptional regulator